MEFETSLLARNGSPLAANGLMSSTTSPLEVLSNAAALIEKSKTCDEFQTKFANSIKELPTKENKLKRNKDRRELAYSSSFKLKARCSSPVRDESMLYERGEHSLSPNFSPSVRQSAPTTPPAQSHAQYARGSPEPALNSHTSYTTYTGFSQRVAPSAAAAGDGLLSAYRGSPYERHHQHHTDGTNHSPIDRRNSDPNSQHSMTGQSSGDSMDADDDQPLDFSNKSRRRPLPDCESQRNVSPANHSSATHSLSQLFAQQMTRPSVITCGSSLMRAQQSGPPGAQPPPPSYADSVSPPINKHSINGFNDPGVELRNGSPGDERRTGTRRLIVSAPAEGVSDPVIEEHFRRSLGKQYSQLFSTNTANNNSITYSVDDHFAKALGDTWVRLQKSADGSQPNNAQSIAS